MKKKILSATMAMVAVTGIGFADPVLVRDVDINRQSITKDNTSYAPIRPVAEALGYGVKWNPATAAVELHGGGFDAFYIKNNTYVKNKVAPVELAHKIILENGITYISVEDLTNHMGLNVDIEGQKMNFMNRFVESVKVDNLVIKAVNEDGTLEVTEGEGIAYVYTKNAKITAYGSDKAIKLTKEDIGKEIIITVPPIMTLIYPPRYDAMEIQVLPKDVTTMIGSVKEVKTGEFSSVLVKTLQSEYLVLVDEKTEIYNQAGTKISLEDIKPGNEILAFHSIMMTKSLPGQTVGYKLIVGAPIDVK